MDDLLHHTPEWRRNAERATRRDNMGINGTASAPNGMSQLNQLSQLDQLNQLNGLSKGVISNYTNALPQFR